MFKGWAILPATDCLFNKKKVTIREIATQWPSGTVVVVEKPNGHQHFIAGSSGTYAKVGAEHYCYHDQTGQQFAGPWKVLEEVTFKTVNGELIATTASGGPAPLQLKAPVAVFK